MKSNQHGTNILSLSMAQDLIQYIEINILEPLTPASIAAHFYTSTSTLSLLFKIVLQMPIMEYVRNRRISLATEELINSNLPIIELAYKYRYETPEAFTKAFTRFHGFPPSFIRRGFPVTKYFNPIQINISIQGGWNITNLTKTNFLRQDMSHSFDYNIYIGTPNKTCPDSQLIQYQIKSADMKHATEWKVIYSLADVLTKHHIPFKIDGRSMIFAHGLEIPIDKLCLTFKWNDELKIKNFFHHYSALKQPEKGFKFFDTVHANTKIRCMFYEPPLNGNDNTFLYQNTDLVQIDNLIVPVQSLQFYYENAEKTSKYYKIVEDYLKKHERL